MSKQTFQVQYNHLIPSVLFVLSLISLLYSQNRPFPRALKFAGCIKPAVLQATMNSTVAGYYTAWKKEYLKKSNGVTSGGGYYVDMKGTVSTESAKSTSEAHGYGMIIMVLMAGLDDSAKIYFDGLYNMYDKHRSTLDRDLMSWVIDSTEQTAKDDNSATDGDMDIAYSLLLAHYQWGSGGAVNYLQEAKRIITSGIKTSEAGSVSYRIKLGDWSSNQWSTRSSDWMTGHLYAYYRHTNDIFWTRAIDTVYSLINTISTNYSPATGLMPDFVVENPPKPAPPDFLEAETDGDYSWNACRFPFRISLDYAHYGRAGAKTALTKIVTWIKSKTNNNPANIKAGYTLAGDQLAAYSSAAFTAPLVTACIIDTVHQAYLNSGWATIKNATSDYFSDVINLLCMLLISGNWWMPEEVIGIKHTTPVINSTAVTIRTDAGNSRTVVTIRTEAGYSDHVKLILYDMLGRKMNVLYGKPESAGRYTININSSAMKKGVYLFKIFTSENSFSSTGVLL